MEAPLYLDTARLGLMCPRAREATYALADLAATEGCSSRFERLLRQGFGAWPQPLRCRYPGLGDWQGVPEARKALGRLAGGTAAPAAFLAGRSAQLMRLAARLVFDRPRRVLVTDLEWPGYVGIIEEERRRAGGELVRVPARDAVLSGGMSAEDLASLIASSYRDRECEAVFLSAVSNLGVRLPAAEACRLIEESWGLGFAVLDGAQAFCHVPTEADLGAADLYLAGCHKWLGAFHPMGLAFCRPRSEGHVIATLRGMTKSRELDDPLLSFSRELEVGRPGRFSETVELSPLFAARAAAAALELEGLPGRGFRTLLENVDGVAGAARGTGWRPLLTAPGLRSGVVLLQAESSTARNAEPERLRASFRERDVVLTAYEGGTVRLSMPRTPWKGRELARLRRALRVLA